MDNGVFTAFREFTRRLAGISLAEGSAALVKARVAPRVRALGLRSEAEYLALLTGESGAAERVHFLDAISTGFTSFWRGAEQFRELAAHARADLDRGQRRFRFWSAACSSGEEPVSMAMALDEVFRATDVDWRVLATDLSTRRLDRAVRGLYTADQLAALSPALRTAHFSPAGRTEQGAVYSVSPALLERLQFRRLNLAEPPFPMRGPLDAVFCRNAMFYLDEPVRQALLMEICRLLKPGGVLYIGDSETLGFMQTVLRPVRPSVFVKIDPGVADV